MAKKQKLNNNQSLEEERLLLLVENFINDHNNDKRCKALSLSEHRPIHFYVFKAYNTN